MVMAIVYTKCGEYDKAIDKLDEVMAQRTIYTVNDLKLNRDLEPLRNLPRYQELIRRYTEDFGV